MAQAYQYRHHVNRTPGDSSLPSTPVSPLLPSQRLSLRTTGNDAHEVNNIQLVSPIMSRSPSIASDSKFSNVSGATGTFPPNPANVHPPPAYVAALGAAQIVSESSAADRGTVPSSDDDDAKPGKGDIKFSEPALALINGFLDQLLFSFLSVAQSTSLAALRPAINDILKYKLAREAIANAEEELQELAGADEDDGKDGFGRDSHNRWDLELVWKRTRLRVMVYMRLGEMEDDDEERHVKEQQLFTNAPDLRRFSSTTGLVSWSAAIFLTSVLEHVAEQTLQAASAATRTRLRRNVRIHQGIDAEDELKPNDTVVVEEQDAERIALNPALGRLWRTWRKTVRGNLRSSTPFQALDNMSTPKATPSIRDSYDTAPEGSSHGDERRTHIHQGEDDVPDVQYPEHILASNIRLPMGDAKRDIDEIEVPGLAHDPDSAEDVATPIDTHASLRRQSFSDYRMSFADRTALLYMGTGPQSRDGVKYKPGLLRRRSSSQPAPSRSIAPFVPVDGKKLAPSDEQAEATMDVGKASAADDDRPTDTLASVAPESDKHSAEDAISRPRPRGRQGERASKDEDDRKSLVGLKTLLAQPSASVESASNVPREAPETAPAAGEQTSGGARRMSTESNHSYSLGGREVPFQPLAQRQHMPADENRDFQHDNVGPIGVAQTSDDVLQSNDHRPSPISTSSREHIATKGSINRIPDHVAVTQSNESDADLERTSSVPRSKYSPRLQEELQDRSRSTSDTQAETNEHPLAAQVSPNEQTRAFLRESLKRASGPSIIADDERSLGQHSSFVPSPSSSTVRMIEHPAIHQQKQQALEPKREPQGLTSANIRGPEDFDQFVQSDTMVKYTLTPESVRTEPASDATSLAHLTGQAGPGVHGSSAKPTVDGRNRSSYAGRSTTGSSPADEDSKSEKRRSITRPPVRNVSAHKKSGLIAREARVMTDPTRDLADFLRSTKPDKEPQVYPILPNRSSTSLQSARSAISGSLQRSQSLNTQRSKSFGRSDTNYGSVPPVPAIPGKSKTSMQPRTAKANGDGSDDLIAFIRAGPKQDGEHRISRSVAPFRSTMDSDQFDALRSNPAMRPTTDAKTNWAPSGTSANSSAVPSTRTSANSRSALLNGGSGHTPALMHPAWSGQPQRLNASEGQDGDEAPRKRYRNKDPYAIDLDDDDEDDEGLLTALPSGKRQEESLADFLRESEPPRDNGPRPIASASSLAQARELMERARANNQNGLRTVAAADGGQRNVHQPQARSATRPAASGTPGVTSAASLTSLPSSMQNQQMRQKVEARPSGGKPAERLGLTGSSGTKELADFLRNSEPPSQSRTAPAPSFGRGGQRDKSSKQEKEKKRPFAFFSFGRSKKGKSTYLDMP